MTNVSTTILIHAPADVIWQSISDFGAACHYQAMVVNCTVEGEGIGALRTLTGADGSTVVERLETLDEVSHRLSYSLQTDTPFGNCQTVMQVRDLGPGLSELVWSATFEPDGLPASEAAALMEGALAANCVVLKQYLER